LLLATVIDDPRPKATRSTTSASAELDPVLAHCLAALGGDASSRQHAAVLFDDFRGADIVLVACDSNSVDSVITKKRQGES